MKQEKNNLENSSSSKNSPKNNLTATMKKKLRPRIERPRKNLPIIIDSLIEGNTLNRPL
jgi:hypothetical protein